MARKVNRQGPSPQGPASPAAMRRWAYQHKWRSEIIRLALSRFEWKGLPDSIDARYIEQLLLNQGSGIFFEVGGEILFAKAVVQGPPDLYENYHDYMAIGAGGQSYQIPQDGGVIVWDSMSRINSWPILELFASELAEIDELAGVNRRQQRTLVTFSGPAEMAADLSRLVRDMEMSEGARVTTEDLSKHVDMKAHTTGISYLQRDFHEDRMATLNQLYSILGIESINFEKSAHMLESEVKTGNDAVFALREDMLFSRQQAAELVNDKFGLNISVDWRNKVETTEPEEIEDGY